MVGYPPVIIHSSRIVSTLNPPFWSYPHDYGNPHMSTIESGFFPAPNLAKGSPFEENPLSASMLSTVLSKVSASGKGSSCPYHFAGFI